MFSSPINGLRSITTITLLLITTIPVTPFYESAIVKAGAVNFLEDHYFFGMEGEADVNREKAEVASWFFPNSNNKVMESTDLNTEYKPVDSKLEAQVQNSSGTDRVVPA
nr:zinc finger protein constans-like 4 [Quercus suber]